MSPALRERLSWWHLKAQRETKDHWVRFVLYYLIFDAFISDGSGSGRDESKLVWFFENDNSLKESFRGGWKTKLIPQAKALRSFSPIRDMRSGSTREVVLDDEEDIEQIIRFIYQIRCNLFHGSKDVMNERDSSLVDHAGQFLKDSIDWWLVSTR